MTASCSCRAPDCTICHPDAADWQFCRICSEPIRKWQADRQSGLCHDCYEQTREETL